MAGLTFFLFRPYALQGVPHGFVALFFVVVEDFNKMTGNQLWIILLVMVELKQGIHMQFILVERNFYYLIRHIGSENTVLIT